MSNEINEIKAELAAISNEILVLKEDMNAVISSCSIMHQTLVGLLDEMKE